MNNIVNRIDQARHALAQAEVVLIGGGAGLSAAAGIEYGGERFERNFTPFIRKYGLTDMYSSGFYPFDTEEERWAYWAKHIQLNRYETGATDLYRSLKQLVTDTNHFVITTNVESQFEKAGFARDRIFEVQGNYGYFQCAKGCHDKLYNNEEQVARMVEQTVDCRIPSELVPQCPVCGGRLDPNLRINQYFVQVERWHASNEAYMSFLQESAGKKVVYLELGIGFNTPAIIRYPFERMTYQNPDAHLIRFNREHPEGPEENESKTIAFTENMQDVVNALLE